MTDRTRRIKGEGSVHQQGDNMSGTDWKARVQAAEAREVALRRKVSQLALNYGTRATHAPTPLAQWADIERDLRALLTPPAISERVWHEWHGDGS